MELAADILIIGGGSAGCMAAIRAKELAPSLEVVVFEKGDLRRSGSIACGMDALNIVALPGVTTPELYLESAGIASEGILDEGPSLLMAQRSYGLLQTLESWGIRFPRGDDSQYIALQVHPKGRFCVEMDAPDLKLVLARRVAEAGVRVVNRTMAVSLLTQDGTVVGVTGLNLRTGDLVVCRAKATILATGGAARFGLPNTGYLYGTYDYPGNTGDGYSLAFHAGAELTGFEYTLTYPLIKDLAIPLLYIAVTRGAEIVNAFGEPVGHGHISQRDIMQEFVENRGPVFVRLRHLPEERIRAIERILFTTERPMQRRFWEQREVDFRQQDIELHPTDYFLCGGHGHTGLVVNERAETSLPGLYAAGDVASVPRQHLTGAFVFGQVAAESAVEFVGGRPLAQADLEQVARLCRRVHAPLEHRGGEVSVEAFEYKLRRTIDDYVVPPKNAYKLNQAVAWMQQFREALPRQVIVRDHHELGRLLEIGSIIDCARLSATASLARRESRWGLFHHRTDFPQRDDEHWLKHVVLRKGEGDEIRVSFRPVEGARL